jgi:hypothetical protein
MKYVRKYGENGPRGVSDDIVLPCIHFKQMQSAAGIFLYMHTLCMLKSCVSLLDRLATLLIRVINSTEF